MQLNCQFTVQTGKTLLEDVSSVKNDDCLVEDTSSAWPRLLAAAWSFPAMLSTPPQNGDQFFQNFARNGLR